MIKFIKQWFKNWRLKKLDYQLEQLLFCFEEECITHKNNINQIKSDLKNLRAKKARMQA